MPLTKHGLEVGTTLLIGANLRGVPDLSDPTKAKLYRDSWLALFDDCSDHEFVAACRAYALKPSSDKDRAWLFPCVAQIRELVPRLEDARRAATFEVDDSEVAWAYVMRMVSDAGWPQADSIPFTLPTREALRAVGGFRAVCRLPDDAKSLSFAKRDFQAAYRSAQVRFAAEIEAEMDAEIKALTAGVNRRIEEDRE